MVYTRVAVVLLAPIPMVQSRCDDCLVSSLTFANADLTPLGTEKTPGTYPVTCASGFKKGAKAPMVTCIRGGSWETEGFCVRSCQIQDCEFKRVDYKIKTDITLAAGATQQATCADGHHVKSKPNQTTLDLECTDTGSHIPASSGGCEQDDLKWKWDMRSCPNSKPDKKCWNKNTQQFTKDSLCDGMPSTKIQIYCPAVEWEWDLTSVPPQQKCLNKENGTYIEDFFCSDEAPSDDCVVDTKVTNNMFIQSDPTTIAAGKYKVLSCKHGGQMELGCFFDVSQMVSTLVKTFGKKCPAPLKDVEWEWDMTSCPSPPQQKCLNKENDTYIEDFFCSNEDKKEAMLCPVTCSLPKDAGLCKASFPRYYWDGAACSKFVYGGCGGNDNRFNTQEACEQTCGNLDSVCRVSSLTFANADLTPLGTEKTPGTYPVTCASEFKKGATAPMVTCKRDGSWENEGSCVPVPKWETTDGNCDVSCGNGSIPVTVECKKAGKTVDDVQCSALGEKPRSSKPCQAGPCACGPGSQIVGPDGESAHSYPTDGYRWSQNFTLGLTDEVRVSHENSFVYGLKCQMRENQDLDPVLKVVSEPMYPPHVTEKYLGKYTCTINKAQTLLRSSVDRFKKGDHQDRQEGLRKCYTLMVDKPERYVPVMQQDGTTFKCFGMAPQAYRDWKEDSCFNHSSSWSIEDTRNPKPTDRCKIMSRRGSRFGFAHKYYPKLDGKATEQISDVNHAVFQSCVAEVLEPIAVMQWSNGEEKYRCFGMEHEPFKEMQEESCYIKRRTFYEVKNVALQQDNLLRA